MGTNYYMSTRSMPACAGYFGCSDYTLTDTPDWGYQIHIGKSSLGWTFLFHGYKHVHSFDDLKKIIKSGEWILYDEYKRPWTLDELESLIDSKKYGQSHVSKLDVKTDADGNEFYYRSFS